MIKNLKATIWLIVAALLVCSNLHGSSLEQQRMSRYADFALDVSCRIAIEAVYQQAEQSPALARANFGDTQVYDDAGPASFQQRYPDIARFSDGTAIAVWEDERNGDWDIFAQLFDSDGSFVGDNFVLASDDNFLSQRQPAMAVDGNDNLIVVWTEEENAHLYEALFSSSMSTIVSRVRIDDFPSDNPTNAPAVTGLAGGGFMAVWEDARDGANIYAQGITTAGSLTGSNFRVNQDVAAAFRLAPDIAAAADGSFAVSWEDARDGETDVYVRLFTSGASPVTGDLKSADATYETAYQFNGQLTHLTETGYLSAWISDRHGEQGVYAQLISDAGADIDTNFQLNGSEDDVCWDLSVRPISGAGAAAVWTNLASMAEMVFQQLGADGAPVGANKQLQDPAVSGERGHPVAAFDTDGGLVVWADLRNYHSDIYAQQLDNAFDKSGSNFLLNDDAIGSQQLSPDITALPSARIAVVWKEQETDGGDIYLQLLTSSGGKYGSVLKLNDDQFRARQASPRIASSYPGGNTVVVWEDQRADGGLLGQNIFGQRLNSSGTPLGGNVLINDDGTSAAKSDPDVAVADNGLFIVTWADERTGTKEIVIRIYDANGSPFGTDRIVSDIAAASEHYSPRISLRADGSFVVTWTAIVGSRRVQYFQRFTSAANPAGSNTPIAVDTSQVDILAADVFAHRIKGDFYVAVVDSQLSGMNVRMLRYDSDGVFSGVDAIACANCEAPGNDLYLTGDVSDALAVTWSDWREGVRRCYLRLIREDGYLLDQNVRISLNSSAAYESSAAVCMRDASYYCTWTDNRNPGTGWDIFAGSGQYTTYAVSDPELTQPQGVTLDQNYPNPFNPSTTIRYYLHHPGWVSLEVFNILGQQVSVLVDRPQPAGAYQVSWGGEGSAGGVYFYRLKIGENVLTKKMTLLK